MTIKLLFKRHYTLYLILVIRFLYIFVPYPDKSIPMAKSIYLDEERYRNIKLTNIISLSLFFLSMSVGIAYLVADVTIHFKYFIILTSPILLIPYLLNQKGAHNLSRYIMSVIFPIWVMYISIDNKLISINMGILNPVNYFDVRIALMTAIVIPYILFSIKEYKWLLLALMPAFCSVIFFDPIHEYFDVGYYDSGLTSTDYYFSANLFTIITMIFLSIAILFLKNQVLKSDLRQSTENEKIKKYLEVLIKLGNSININSGKVKEAKIEILEAAKNCFEVSRVSIWNYSADGESISCEMLLQKELLHPNSALSKKDYPRYFEALSKQQLIIAHDAANNPITSEFEENYLSVYDIKSMIDAPFLSVGKLGGVICCEHQGDYKTWGAAESMLLKALGDFLSYAISMQARNEQNEVLKLKNEEILKMNENLELMVQKRTQELEAKNKQLTEYAYINSHLLRAPVARISGLYHLFQMQGNDDIEILNHMNSSILELEAITLNINKAIEANSAFDRSHVRNN